jgi:hypothetical protein
MTIDIFNVEKLRVFLAPDKCKNVSQRSQGTNTVCLRVSLQKTSLTEAQNSSLWFLVTGIVNFVDGELRNRSDVLIPTETVTSLLHGMENFNFYVCKLHTNPSILNTNKKGMKSIVISFEVLLHLEKPKK